MQHVAFLGRCRGKPVCPGGIYKDVAGATNHAAAAKSLDGQISIVTQDEHQTRALARFDPMSSSLAVDDMDRRHLISFPAADALPP